ncbi:unnamed protein product [Diatraea saccharalis]|uniref:GPI ethanolamine phosphate transferase 1 n=1 Tax=Diatraea saccharalis TaxID=40085 RepID=A0A9N9RGL0_9NEOP|nr:unnamed protein product [Diatraea saccharalis]
MFILGLCIHIIFLFSIFDIYFKSPIVKNVVPYQPQHVALADRLVLFVVDGLRAESFVNYTTMPYLRTVANTYGRWGISNTRMPTESRPGHVAIIAGFYEDPSSVMKGWKENPVDFDSVFNQSYYTWCWGAYDIVDIFTKGGINDHIFTKKFDPYDQTFSTDKNTTYQDKWVFNNVNEFLNNAKYDPGINEKLHASKIIFFLHLLGTDTSGHTHKPKTESFLTTLRHVDEGIRQIEEVIRKFYNDDGRTTFLMTSDHGMTDWGSHGAGHAFETETPYVLWGSGIHQAKRSKIDPGNLNMSLNHRFDISQADLAPLMSTVLSIPVPVNSVGRVPLEIMDLTIINKAKAIYSNSRQLAAQYDKKRQAVEENAWSILYKPYEPFNKKKFTEIIEFTEKLMRSESLEDFEKLIILSEEIIQLSLSGLEYYQNYYQRPLLVLVTLSFIGWIVYLMKSLLEQNVKVQINSSDLKNHKNDNSGFIQSLRWPYILFLLTVFIITGLVYAQKFPLQYYIYTLTPLFLWKSALSPLSVWRHILRQSNRSKKNHFIWVEVICYTAGSYTLGMSFTQRWMLIIPLLGMALWPIFSSASGQLTVHMLIAWPITCILLSCFSLMPVIGKVTKIELVISAGLLWIFILIIYTWKVLLPLCEDKRESNKQVLLTITQMMLLGLSLHNIYVQSNRFDDGRPVSQIYQGLAWTIAVTCFFIPLVFTKRLICRLVAIYTSILNFYLLLSVSHEGLFIVTLITNITCWLFIEFRLLPFDGVGILEYRFEVLEETSKDFINFERGISRQDFRRAFFFTTYIVLAFFGTGNIASLNSFEVRWVTCFITSFRPFIITTLILLKTLSPFLMVACTFRAVQHLTKAPKGYLHIIVLIYSNIMGIQLLYNVKNYGSWLDIGTSISQFVIVQVITLFIVLINQIARILTDFSIILFIRRLLGKRIKKYD